MRHCWTVAIAAVIASSAGGCVATSTRDCGDGTLCPLATTCEHYAQFGTDEPLRMCVPDAQITDCDGLAEGAACTVKDSTAATSCYSGACLPSGCGNRIVDPGEICDDGNRNDGDRCSADCRSLEVCGNGIVDAHAGETCDDGNLRSRDGCSSACATERLTWTVPSIPADPPTRDMHLAYDSARDVTLLFGGDTTAADAGVLWAFDGRGWTPHPTAGPHGRDNPAFAYDPRRRVAVLYGDAQTHDTWEWDGVAWHELAPPLDPGTRKDAALAWDPRLGKLVLFGGFRTGAPQLADTWTWDGTAWVQLTAAVAPALAVPALAYDAARDVLVLTGTLAGARVVEEMGADGLWHEAPSTFGNPPGGAGLSTFAWDPAARVTVLSTSQTGVAFATWNGLGWAAISGAFATGGPVALATRGATGQLLAYTAGRMFADTETGKPLWVPVTADTGVEPPGQLGAAYAYDPFRRRVVMIGGSAAQQKGLWSWDGGWTEAAYEAPVGFLAAAATYDAAHDVFVVVRGAETWTLDAGTLATWQQQATSPAPARTSAAMTYDVARGRVVLFGGLADDGTKLGDTWTWDGTAWTQIAGGAVAPSPRLGALAYDPVRGRAVLAGGGDPTAPVDTWEWDGAAWTQIATPVSPEAQPTHLAWDAGLQRVVLVGESGLRDAWAYDGATWRELAIAVPLAAPEIGYGLTSDPSGAGVFMVQAFTSGAPFDAHLRYEADREEVCTGDGALDADGDTAAGCADVDCTFACAPLCTDATAASCTSARCGDATCDARFETWRSCPADCAPPDICGDGACTGAEATACAGDCH